MKCARALFITLSPQMDWILLNHRANNGVVAHHYTKHDGRFWQTNAHTIVTWPTYLFKMDGA